MKGKWSKIGFLLLTATAVTLLSAAKAGHSSLFCGTDATGFSGLNGQIAVAHTSGASVIDVKIYDFPVPINGLTYSSGPFIWAGQPEDVGTAAGNTLRKISLRLPPTVLSTIPPGPNSFSTGCCNEQMVFTPTGFYHAHYSDVIQRIVRDSSGDSEVAQTFQQSDVVGMAYDGTKIWITKWGGKQVGTWDPATNVFTSVFSTPADAGALAWDVTSGVLWVGMSDGTIIPYDATGNKLGNGFQPFGAVDLDGLAFVP